MSEIKFTPGGIGFGMPVRISKFLPEDCIYVASEGTLKKALLTFNTVADQELEIARLRSHVSRLEAEVRDEKRRAEYAEGEARNLKQNLAGTDELLKTVLDEKIALEESLRVALEARAEAVEVLREVEWGDHQYGRLWCPVCSGTPGTAQCDGHTPDCRLARAIGKGE